MTETLEQKRAKILRRMFNVKFSSDELYFVCQEFGIYPKDMPLQRTTSQSMMLDKLMEKVSLLIVQGAEQKFSQKP